MAIKRLYQKLTVDHNDFGFDSETSRQRKRELELKAQRLQFIVYAALFAFVVLAAYGYFLIYNLTHDVHHMSYQMNQMTYTFQRMTASVETNMDIMSSNFQKVSRIITTTMPRLTHDTSYLQDDIRQMVKTMNTLNQEIKNIAKNMALITNATVNMQRDMWSMNKNVSDPFGTMMDNMTPWGLGKKAKGSPGPLPYPPLPAR